MCARRFAPRTPPLLHSHYTFHDVECSLGALGADAKVIWHVRNGLYGYPFKQRVKDLVKVRILGRLCDAVVANSAQTRRDCLLRGFPEHKVELILNGVVLDRVGATQERTADVRAGLGIPEDAFVFLAFGWDPHRKGVDLLLKAVEEARRQGKIPSAALAVTGGEELERMVGPGARPPWLHVLKPMRDVSVLYAAADVFVSSSREDAFSYAIGEAMASGLPVVSSDIPGPSHYFGAGGLLRFRTEDWRSLQGALEQVAEAPDRPALGKLNRDYVERFGIETYVDNTIELYERLLGAPRGARRPRPPQAGVTPRPAR